MLRNYFKIALRNLSKHKTITGINLLGLTVGLCSCILISIYVLHEKSYDRHFPDHENMYRITRSFSNKDGEVNLHLGALAPAFGPRLLTDYPQIRQMTRIFPNGTTILKKESENFNEENAFYADEQFIDFFGCKLIRGDVRSALKEPRSLVLSSKLAEKIFPGEDPVNKTIRVDNQNDFKITGVFKSFPANSHFHPELLLSFSTLNDSAVYGERNLMTSWSNNSFCTYIKLSSEKEAAALSKDFTAFIDRHMGSLVPATVKMSKFTGLHLMKVSDIHLHSNLDSELEANGSIDRVYIFGCIALFVLIIACINYMNLSTARAAIRSKEIGIRKTIGAVKRELVLQFLSESVVLTFLAELIALILLFPALTVINNLSGQELSVSVLLRPEVFLALLSLPLVIGVLSGLYPALFMSGFNTVKVLKGVFRVEAKGLSVRKALVVFQFSVSIILIVATIVVFRQVDYMRNTSLGFDKDHVITANYYNSLNDKYETFRQTLLSDPSIKAVTRSSRIPTGRLLDDLGAVSVIVSDSAAQSSNAGVKFVRVDHDFISSYRMELAAGRSFSRDFSTDSGNFVLNETAVRILGFKDVSQAVGKTLRYGGQNGKLIGVLKDFHFESMHEPIVPLILLLDRSNFNRLSFSVRGPQAISKIEKAWKSVLPDVPFDYQFMNDNVADLYEAEEQQMFMFTVFSGVAILIACLGLFGLSAFAISRRVKEIGVRRVLGAHIHEIIRLLSVDFLRLVMVAALIALPLSYVFMDKWLRDFAYRINIPWWALAVAGAGALLLAFVTISSLAYKAASTNPAKSLRTE